MQKIYITGVSGNGKSAIVKEFNKRGVVAFDIEEIPGLCYWVSKQTQKAANDYSPTLEWLQSHDWVCNTEKLKDFLAANSHHDIIITGITGNQDEFLSWFDKIFLLQSSKETFLKRLETRHLNPGENSFGKNPVEREFAAKNHQDFEAKLLNLGATPINSESNIATVADQILDKI